MLFQAQPHIIVGTWETQSEVSLFHSSLLLTCSHVFLTIRAHLRTETVTSHGCLTFYSSPLCHSFFTTHVFSSSNCISVSVCVCVCVCVRACRTSVSTVSAAPDVLFIIVKVIYLFLSLYVFLIYLPHLPKQFSIVIFAFLTTAWEMPSSCHTNPNSVQNLSKFVCNYRHKYCPYIMMPTKMDSPYIPEEYA